MIFLLFFLFIFSLNSKPRLNLKKKDNYFVVIVPSYNNESWCLKNLESIVNQKYPYFRIIYINDCSTDNTKALTLNYLKEKKFLKRCRYIDNKVRLGSLNNIYLAAHSCNDEEIIVLVDGDDWLYSNNVLNKLNKIYNIRKPLITYGQFIYLDSGKIGFCQEFANHIIKERSFRNYLWNSSHLKTFKAGLFKKIKKEDLMHEGKFFEMSGDLAFMYPMLEMAANRIYFVSDVLYIYNNTNPLNDSTVNLEKQAFFEQIIKQKPKYRKINLY